MILRCSPPRWRRLFVHEPRRSPKPAANGERFQMKRIAIIGGGVSGLSAAYALQKQVNKAAELDYVLFEAGSRFGGVIHTERVGDFVIEAGPDSFLTEKPWAAELCRELGLGDQLIASNDAERRTYILLGGQLVPLPDGLMFMV